MKFKLDETIGDRGQDLLRYPDLLEAMQTLVNALKTMDITEKLWIIQKGTVRIDQEEPEP
ncbi:MAG TPA: hypothetical protein V6D20_15770 [Candidatus Obscuribacterales bacterium]